MNYTKYRRHTNILIALAVNKSFYFIVLSKHSHIRYLKFLTEHKEFTIWHLTSCECFFLEFFGCRFHTCDESGCKTKCPPNDTSENDRRKLCDLATMGTVIMMRECKWRKANVKVTFSPISDFYYKAGIVTEEMILAAVAGGTLFGIIEIDLFTPNDVKKRLQEINFPAM